MADFHVVKNQVLQDELITYNNEYERIKFFNCQINSLSITFSEVLQELVISKCTINELLFEFIALPLVRIKTQSKINNATVKVDVGFIDQYRNEGIVHPPGYRAIGELRIVQQSIISNLQINNALMGTLFVKDAEIKNYSMNNCAFLGL